jgi:tRNA A37 threonylcarbamoyltransferase TsaD
MPPAARSGAQVHYPPLALCTDNGAMIALAAAMRWQPAWPPGRRRRLRRAAALAAARSAPLPSVS